jgi:hypothetical protein
VRKLFDGVRALNKNQRQKRVFALFAHDEPIIGAPGDNLQNPGLLSNDARMAMTTLSIVKYFDVVADLRAW